MDIYTLYYNTNAHINRYKTGSNLLISFFFTSHTSKIQFKYLLQSNTRARERETKVFKLRKGMVIDLTFYAMNHVIYLKGEI